MANIGIIGYGVVGKATADAFGGDPSNKIFWFDKNVKGPFSIDDVIKNSEFIFVCVPTPMFHDGSGIDLSIINKVVSIVAPKIKNTKKILIIKSSVVPGTTRSLSKKYPKVRFAMNPEFLTEVNAVWDFMHPDRVVVGAENEADALEIIKIHKRILGYEVKMFITDSTTAEMVKYMANTFLATKSIFANEMKGLSEKLSINYDDVKKMVAADPRIGEWGLSVTPFKGVGGKCYPKDTIALLGLARKLKIDLSILDAAWKKNLKIRKIRDWEEIDGAVNFKKTKTSKK